MTSRITFKRMTAIVGAVAVSAALWSSGAAQVHAETPAANPVVPAAAGTADKPVPPEPSGSYTGTTTINSSTLSLGGAGTLVLAATPDPVVAVNEMSEAALNFWNALAPEQQAKVGLEFKGDYRTTWHFVPAPPTPRKGLTVKDMTSDQRALAYVLLASGLSYQGYSKALDIMSLDAILKILENGKGPTRDPELYYFSIYGTPGSKDAWGWRVEGHHLSLSFTIVDGKQISASPAFYGNNPAKVLSGPRAGLRTLAPEEDQGRAFVKSLTEEQKKKAVLAEPAPKEIYTAADRKAQLESTAGITFAELTPEAKTALKTLVTLYADRHRGEIAAADLGKIEAAGWDKIIFAWQGGLEPGQPHYYRIKGTTFLIEYDNTQNNANHIHTVWRDLTNDFGDDILAKHYGTDHAGK